MAKAKDFFISYTGADVVWAEWIAQTLEEAGYTTVLQAWDFRPGDNFIQRMDEALADADRVMAVLSAAYFASEYARDEWTAALVRARGEHDRLLPVRIEAVELPPLLATRVYVDLVGLDEQVAAERLVAGVRPGRAKRTVDFPGGRGGVSFPGRRPAVFEVPPRNRHFTGRGDLLQALRQQLAETKAGAVVQVGAVHGLGGVGKTQLAVEYAHRYAADYDLVWWVAAELPATISGRLAALGRRLGLDELPSLEEQVGVVFDALGQRDRWLLVYDNAQHPADLAGLRPPAGGGHLLVTSRNPAWGAMATTLRVEVLPRAEAIAFLQSRTGRDDPTAAELAAALGDLPLALEQAAAYLEQTPTSLRDYLQLFRERAAELLRLGKPADYPHTVATTWAVSLERVRAEAPAAEDLLALCSFLAPDDIPRTLAGEHVEVLPELLRSAVSDRLAYDQMLGALGRYSLVTVTEDALAIHRLVQLIVRDGLGSDTTQRWAGVTVRLVAAAFPNDGHDVRRWPTCARLLPHVLAATEHAGTLNAEPEATVDLLRRAALYLMHRSEWRQARQLLESALEIGEAWLGPNHPDVAQAFFHLGVVLRPLGDLPAARAALERALAIREARLSAGDEFAAGMVAISLDSLGEVLRDLGDLPAARAALERALAIREARVGADDGLGDDDLAGDDLEVAVSLQNQANALRDQGDLRGARAALRRAAAIWESHLGSDDPEMEALTQSALGIVLWQLEDLPAARAAYERALAIWEERHGPNHPEMAGTLMNLGVVLRQLGDLPAARASLERAVTIQETSLGPDHLNVSGSLFNLGHLLRDLGDLPAARAAFERALVIWEERLGPDHPGMAGLEADLAAVLTDLDEQSKRPADDC